MSLFTRSARRSPSKESTRHLQHPVSHYFHPPRLAVWSRTSFEQGKRCRSETEDDIWENHCLLFKSCSSSEIFSCSSLDSSLSFESIWFNSDGPSMKNDLSSPCMPVKETLTLLIQVELTSAQRCCCKSYSSLY